MIITVSVVAMNEEKYLPNLLEDFCKQNYPLNKIEILLVDSCSTDSTKRIMLDFKEQHKEFYRVEVFDNPKKNQASGWNVAINNYIGDALIRIDAHSSISESFVKKNYENFQKGEMVSGGIRKCITDNKTLLGDLLLNTENSVFGFGFNKSRRSKKKTYVKSMFHASYMREVFDKAGLFNENLLRTEDNEMHYRIRKSGYKLFFDPEIVSFQYSRNTFKKMIKQKYLNGYWVGLTLGVSPRCLSLYHFAPFFFLLALLICLGLIFTQLFVYPLIGVIGLYFLLTIITAVISFFKNGRNPFSFLMPFLLFILHLSYGIGTFIGIICMPFKRHKLTKRIKEIL